MLICVARLVGSLRNSWKKMMPSHWRCTVRPVTRKGEYSKVSIVLSRGDLTTVIDRPEISLFIYLN